MKVKVSTFKRPLQRKSKRNWLFAKSTQLVPWPQDIFPHLPSCSSMRIWHILISPLAIRIISAQLKNLFNLTTWALPIKPYGQSGPCIGSIFTPSCDLVLKGIWAMRPLLTQIIGLGLGPYIYATTMYW